MQSGCVICGTRTPRAVGVLCATCATRLVIGERRAPGIVAVRAVPRIDAWLIDGWGQLHAIASPCRIGRADHNDVRIADLSVSSGHAELVLADGAWALRDLGSSNGSGIGTRPVGRAGTLRHLERVWFGSLAFLLWAAPEPPAGDVPPPHVRTLVPGGAAFRLHGPADASIVIRAAHGHMLSLAPGELHYHAQPTSSVRRAALPRLQYQLMRVLCEAAVVAGGDARDGFVRTSDLVASLPFQTATPSANHLRQVVASARGTLARAGIADDHAVIEGREGFGYRVRWEVTPIAEDIR